MKLRNRQTGRVYTLSEDLLKIYPRVVVRMPEDYDKDGEFKDIEAVVEIYDYWRE